MTTSQLPDEVDRKIVMAVDFGTTFSGLAWAHTRKPEVQTPIIQWPDATSGGLEGITSDKVPTELQYNGHALKWGFQIDGCGPRHQNFKLDLDHRSEVSKLAKAFPDLKSSPPGYDYNVEELVTDYLTALRKHAEQVLRYKLPPSALQSVPIEFVITVPAVWSDLAQAKTRACAEKAGMGTGSALHIISEPEAAAMYALNIMDPHNVEVGDTFVLCDAGGGTVDLISYTVSALKPILEIIEASPGSGSLCGSSFLNRIFEQCLRKKLNGNPGWDEDVLEEAMKHFEVTIKRQFRGLSGEEFKLLVPGLVDDFQAGIRRGRITVTGADIEKVFEPVIREVISLIKGQIESTILPVKAVLLVGGFGQNAYLRDRIRQAVGSNVEVMQSPNSWTAVVRGALMKGISATSSTFATVKIRQRLARKHYGIAREEEFLLGFHDAARRYWSNYHRDYRFGTISWFIKQGDAVVEDEPFQFPFYNVFLVSGGHPSSIEINLMTFQGSKNSQTPTYDDETGVSLLVKLVADLSRIPLTKIAKAKGKDGQLYYRVDFVVQATYYSAYTKYELIYDGINYGSVASEYV